MIKKLRGLIKLFMPYGVMAWWIARKYGIRLGADKPAEPREAPPPVESPKYKLYNGAIQEDKAKPYCIIVSPISTRSGCPIHTLSMLRELNKKFNVLAVSLCEGELDELYKAESWRFLAFESVVRYDGDYQSKVLTKLIDDYQFKFAIVNSAFSGLVLKCLKEKRIPSVVCIHEFAQYCPPGSVKDCFQYGTKVVFSSKLCRDSVLKEVGLSEGEAYPILPQGKSSLPVAQTEKISVREAELFSRLETRKKKGEFIVFGVGTVYRKGFDLFLRTAARIKAQNPSRRFCFVVAGSGYDPLHDTQSIFYSSQIENLGLREDFEYLGEVKFIDRVYELSDLYLLTSILDPLPGTVIESMSHKLPVICFDKTSGFPEMFETAGFAEKCVAKYLDVEHMAELATKLISDKAAYDSLAEKQLAFYEMSFDMPTYVKKIVALASEDRL